MRLLSTWLLVIAAITPSIAQTGQTTSLPVEYRATATASAAIGDIQTTLTIHIASYTTEFDRGRLMTALRTNGYQSFLPVFRRTPVVGYVAIKDQKWELRWAQQQPRDAGQLVTVATDKPIYFLGGGNVDAKPRAGYEMAVIRLELNGSGTGTGSFAAAARVKPTNDATSVEVDDYAGGLLKITSVERITGKS
jgi:hypothetical protein